MTRIEPNFFYQDLPCSVVSIGCAMEKLQGKFFYDKIIISRFTNFVNKTRPL